MTRQAYPTSPGADGQPTEDRSVYLSDDYVSIDVLAESGIDPDAVPGLLILHGHDDRPIVARDDILDRLGPGGEVLPCG